MTDGDATALEEALRALEKADVESEAILLALSDPLTDDDAERYLQQQHQQAMELRRRWDREALRWEQVNGQMQAHIPEGAYYITRKWHGWFRWGYTCTWERGDAHETCPDRHTTVYKAQQACRQHQYNGIWSLPKKRTAKVRVKIPAPAAPKPRRYYTSSRTRCLLCGKEIYPVNTTPLDPRETQFSEWRHWVVVFRYHQPDTTGWAHCACAHGKKAHDRTGKPDYSGYESDGALPAYPQGYDAARRGREHDALCRQHWLRQADPGT